jgi:hypothetical protein
MVDCHIKRQSNAAETGLNMICNNNSAKQCIAANPYSSFDLKTEHTNSNIKEIMVKLFKARHIRKTSNIERCTQLAGTHCSVCK